MARQNALKPIEDSHTQNFTAVVQVTFFLCVTILILLNLIQSVTDWIVQSQPFHVQSKPGVFCQLLLKSP